MKHVIAKTRKINSVAGNIKYLGNTDDHTEICYVHSTCSNELWLEYAEINQKEFLESVNANREGCKCVEAHETVFIFPHEFYRLSNNELYRYTDYLAEEFKKKYGCEVLIALHGSDQDCNNLHVHVMYMERKKEHRGQKIATKRLYFNERGKQVKSRKDAIDQEGNLLPGYSFVKTGEAYGGTKEWTSKNPYLKSNQFLKDQKIWWENELNQVRENEWAKDIEERKVYDPETSPYLPLQDKYKPLKYRDKSKQLDSIEKAMELSEEIDFTNFLKIEYNEKVDEALRNGADLEELVAMRKNVSADIKEAVKSHQMGKINEIIIRGTKLLEQLIERLKTAAKELETILGKAKEFLHEKNKQDVAKTGAMQRKTDINALIMQGKQMADKRDKKSSHSQKRIDGINR